MVDLVDARQRGGKVYNLHGPNVCHGAIMPLVDLAHLAARGGKVSATW
jgi:hypothetical protein